MILSMCIFKEQFILMGFTYRKGKCNRGLDLSLGWGEGSTNMETRLSDKRVDSHLNLGFLV